MKVALIYTYWQYYAGDPAKNLLEPIIASIASFRFHHPDIPIHVIDISDFDVSWDNWIKRLKFQVHKKQCSVTFINHNAKEKCGKERNITVWMKNLSRPEMLVWLMKQIKEDIIVSVDCDIAFIDKLLPLQNDCDKINMGFNTGLFYMNKSLEQAKNFMNVWSSMCIASAQSEVIFDEIISDFKPIFPIFHEETVSRHILEDKKLFEYNDNMDHENCLLHTPWRNKQLNLEMVKAVHLHYSFLKHDFIKKENRGQWFLFFKETKQAIEQFFSEKEITQFFGIAQRKSESFKDLKSWESAINITDLEKWMTNETGKRK